MRLSWVLYTEQYIVTSTYYDPAHFPVAKIFLKKTEMINVNTLKIVEKWIRDKIYHGIHWYAMSQKLPLDNFEWKDNISKFDKNFMKNYNEYSQKEYIFEIDVEHSKQLQEYTMI